MPLFDHGETFPDLPIVEALPILALLAVFKHLRKLHIHALAKSARVSHVYHALNLNLGLEFFPEDGDVLGPGQASLDKVDENVHEALHVVAGCQQALVQLVVRSEVWSPFE